MMTNVVTKAWQAVRPHVPLIKFRKGSAAGHGGKVVAAAAAPPSGSKPSLKAVQAPLIEDWQLPHRYRRQPLTPQEVDYINRGGPE